MTRNRRIIAIAGAGIAGMTAALCLEKVGFRVQLFEKAEAPAATGTGIQVSPNAFKVLAGLGLSRSLTTIGFAPEQIEIGDGVTGKPLTQFHLGNSILQRHGAPYLLLHRIDLVQILQNACDAREDIEIFRGRQVCDIVAHMNGVTMMSAGGGEMHEHVVSAIIGADGVWSTLREFVHGFTKPVFTGQIAWRGLMAMADAPARVSHNSTGLWLGAKSHLVHYPLRQGRMLNIVAITPWEKDTPPKQGWLRSDFADNREAAFSRWQPDLRNLLNTDIDWGGWPLFAAERVGSFANGPLCLIGDAAHAMVPFGAQGGATGIEDAVLLANECQQSPHDLPAAFERFNKMRMPRVRDIIKLSQNNGRLYHMRPPFSLIRNIVMKRTPQETLQKRMDWLYGWAPPGVVAP